MPNDLNLLPCPFCASERVGPRSEPALHIACRDCGAQLWGHRNHFPPNGERAAEAWNRRAQPAATPVPMQEQGAPSDAEIDAIVCHEIGMTSEDATQEVTIEELRRIARALLARHGVQPAVDSAMERVLAELVNKIVPGLDTGDLLADAATASKALGSAQPLFWYRPRSDSLYEGPIHNASIERVRKESGGWVPLYPGAAPVAAQAQPVQDEREAFVSWLHGTYPRSHSQKDAERYWSMNHVAALAWRQRAAQASGQAQDAEERTRYLIEKKSVLPVWEEVGPAHSSLENALEALPYYRKDTNKDLRIVRERRKVVHVDAARQESKGGEG